MLTLWAGARMRAVMPYVLTGAMLLLGLLLLGDEVARHLHAVEAWLDGLGPTALLVFVLLHVVLASLFVPDALLGIVAGASFGFARGFAAVLAGSLLGALVQYALARRLLRPAIEALLARRPTLAAIQAAVRRQELRLQVLIRLTPLNRALTSYLLGATGVDAARFAVACLAIVPSLAVEVYFGYAGTHLVTASARHGAGPLAHDILLGTGLVVAIVVMVAVSTAARRAVEAATGPAPTAGPGGSPASS